MLGGLAHGAGPLGEAPAGFMGRESYDGPTGDDGDDAGDPDLGAFLQGPVPCLALDERGDEADLGHGPRANAAFMDPRDDGVAGYGIDGGGGDDAMAIQEFAGIAGPEAEHDGGVA